MMKTPTIDRRSVTLCSGARVTIWSWMQERLKRWLLTFKRRNTSLNPLRSEGDAVKQVERSMLQSQSTLGSAGNKIQMSYSWRSILVSSVSVNWTLLLSINKSCNCFIHLFCPAFWSLVSHPGVGIYANETMVHWTRLLRSLAVLRGGHRTALTYYMTDECPRNWRTYWRIQHTL